MSDTVFRVLGSVVNSDEAYVDVNLLGVDEYANLYFERQDGSESYTIEAKQLRKLASQGSVIGESNMSNPAGGVWSTLSTMGSYRQNPAVPEKARKHLSDAIEQMFRAAAMVE